MKDNPFVWSLDAFENQLDKLEVTGNDKNEPSSTLDTIWYASSRSNWRPVWGLDSDTDIPGDRPCDRYVLVFTDAKSKEMNEKTRSDIKNTKIDKIWREINDTEEKFRVWLTLKRVVLMLWGPADEKCKELIWYIPHSDFIELDNPEVFYNKDRIRFGRILELWGRTLS